MNAANLQIEGLLMAIASLHRLLIEKGLLEASEIDTMLRKSEARITGDDRFNSDIPLASRDAMCFAARFLRQANSQETESPSPGFSELARRVGQSKQPFNDQR